MKLKRFFIPFFCVFFVLAFSFQSLAAGDQTLTLDQVNTCMRLTSVQYIKAVGVTSSLSFNNSMWLNKNPFIFNGQFGDICAAWAQFNVSDTSTPFNSLMVNVPLFLYNVTSFNLDVYLCLDNGQGSGGNFTGQTYYTNCWEPTSAKYLDNNNIIHDANVAYRGTGSFTYTYNNTTSKTFTFRKYTLYGNCVDGGAPYTLKYVRFYIDFPFENLYTGTNARQNKYMILGLMPETPVFTSLDPQTLVLQNNLFDIEYAINQEKQELKQEIQNATAALTTDIDNENINLLNVMDDNLDHVKDETENITDGLALSEQWQDEESTMNAISYDSIMDNMPEDFDDTSTEVSEVLQDAFSDTPLTELLILVFTFATIGYILFGKKAT